MHYAAVRNYRKRAFPGPPNGWSDRLGGDRPGPARPLLRVHAPRVEFLVDGKLVVRGLFPKGSRREFANGGTFTLTLGNAGAVDVVVDGRPLGTLGGEHEIVKNYVIDAARNG